MSVSYKIEDGTCLVTIDNPPVNVIGRDVRVGLDEALNAAKAATVHKVIVTGAGAAFAAGADAREFDGPPLPPHLPEVLAKLEALPSIAVLNGIALGGGFEIALACRKRIAAPGVLMGLPEVTLGVVPGAGGTQRLPRIAGIAAAARLVSEGCRFKAEEGLALGVIDSISGDPLALAFAMPAEEVRATPPASQRPFPAADPEAIDAARALAGKRAKGQIAPMVALDLIASTADIPFEKGIAAERASFLDLRTGPQARAMRHVFFAERAANSRSRSFGVTAAQIGSALVVGGGTMGAGIAYALDGIGVSVVLVEADDAAANRARSNIAKLFDDAVKRGKSGQADAETGKQRIMVVTGYTDLPPVDIAIEAVFENEAVKRQVFAALDAALPPQSILATNTSYLDVNRIFNGVSHPERCIGLHFFSPAHVMKLLEVIRAKMTSPATLAAAFSLAARLRKIPVEAGVCDGFIGNRILTRYRQICDVMLVEGALPWQVDTALTDFGMAMGPYAVQDLSGLDIAYANRKRKNLREAKGIRYIPVADRMVEDLGRLGRKSGAGWYDYPENGRPTEPEVVRDVIEAASADLGVARKLFDNKDIVDRAMAAMIDEGLRILDEGIASRAADVDLVLVHGYGFPRWRGGPMHYADTIGLPELRQRIVRYAEDDPLSWSVPPFLDRLIAEGSRLAGYTSQA